MKKHFNLLNFLCLVCIVGIILCSYGIYNRSVFINKLKAVNARIEFLVNEGYTVDAAKHIADVEFGIVPADDEYQALIED